MFAGCSSLATIATNAFNGLNTTSGTVTKIFQNCTGLKEVPSGLFKNNAKITNYTYAFNGCTSLEKVGSEVFNCAANASINNMFAGCTSLKEVGENLFINPEKVKLLTYIFKGCSSLESVPTGTFDNFKAATNINYMFDGCVSLSGESPYTVVNGVKYHLYERTADNKDASGFAALSYLQNAFRGCTKLSDYNQIPDICKGN